MKPIFFVLALIFLPLGSHAAELLPIEQEVVTAVKSPQVTIVHFWAPWCPNCKAELANNRWANFIATNRDVKFIFITVWQGDKGADGRAVLEQNGVGLQSNVQVLVHPNASRKKEDRMAEFLGLPVTWIPSTWVFRDGALCYALNYGELRFPMLQQLIRDASDKWEH
jgi:thiol-disulfide isomerase/thioredoxin